MTALLLILGMLFVGISVAAILRLVTNRRLRTVERLADIQTYGFGVEAGAPVIRAPIAGNLPTRVANRVGELFARYFGAVREEPLRAELMSAGIYMVSPRTLIGYRVIAAIVLPILILILLGLTILSVLLAAVMSFAGWMLPLIVVRRRARLRLKEIDKRLPDLIDLLVVTIEAGLGFTGALRMAASHLTGPLGDELNLTLQQQTMGLAVQDALGNLMARADTQGMRSFVRAMAQGERLGISMGQIMRNLAIDMRKRRRKDAEERAQKAPIKMLFPLIFLIFPALYIVLLVPAGITLFKTLGGG
jgi:tight adherence protein C